MQKEFEFLNIISDVLSNSDYLGNDCAYLSEYNLAISSDSLIEDIHFKQDYMSPYEIAKKAFLSNVSDILASGAKPKYALIALSGEFDKNFVKDFYEGINQAADEFEIKIIGGDLTKAPKISINITVLGDYKNKNISSRNNAKKNYIVAVAGEFGSSAQGLCNLLKDKNSNDYFSKIHKCPVLHPKISDYIAKNAKYPYAMMDSSDGLCDCLYQISSKSGVRIDIEYDKIPKKTVNKDFVLNGGEDYSLVICLDKRDFNNLNLNLVNIGECKEGCGVFCDGNELKYSAYNHFS